MDESWKYNYALMRANYSYKRQKRTTQVDRGGAAPPNNYGEKNVFTDEIATYMN